MYKVRKEQMDVMDQAAREVLYASIVTHLRRMMPTLTKDLSESELIRRVEESAVKAIDWGIKTDAGMTRFVCLAFIAGPCFDELPSVQKYLRSSNTDVELKIDRLSSYVVRAIEKQQVIEV